MTRPPNPGCIYKPAARARNRRSLADRDFATLIGIAFGGLLCSLASFQAAQAISFTSFDARSMAMGGAGVASAESHDALHFNPALLIEDQPGTKSFFVRPFLGLRRIDRDNFIDALEIFQDNDGKNRLDAALDRFDAMHSNLTETESDALKLLDAAQDVTDEAGRLFSDFENLSNKPLRLAGSAGASFGRAERRYGYAGSIRETRIGGAIINLSEADSNRIRNSIETTDRFIDDLSALVPDDPSTSQVSALYDEWDAANSSDREDLSSTYEFTGAIARETAFSYAMRADESDTLSVGITLKYIDFVAIDYVELLDDAELADIREGRFQKSFGDVNLDLGLATDFAQHARFALVVRNLVPRNYRSVRGREFRLRPLVRIGGAWEPGNYTLTADLDLTTNDPLGFDPDKRYLALGGEWRASRFVALRAGYRYNTVSADDLWSVGLGIGPRPARFDIAVAAQGDELGAAMQLAIYF